MSTPYTPGPAAGARVHKEGDKWTLVLTRDLRHPPEKVWLALTDPKHLAQWAPFDADRNMATPGPVTLSTVGTPTPQISEATVKRAEPHKLIEYNWGGGDLRWELEPFGNTGTRLKLWHNIDHRFISWGAAGWHICFDVLDHLLAGDPLGRMVGPAVMQFDGWQRLKSEYAQQFEAEA
jgi:uncharacterized protein YndB with AHSA1/START domain